MDHSAHTQLDASELTEDNLVAAVIYDANDDEVGNVSHLHGSGPGSSVIVDVGGFLGLGARPVALSTDKLTFMRDEGGDVHATTALTKKEIEALPEHHHH